jgi:IS605 OrfB family transposase
MKKITGITYVLNHSELSQLDSFARLYNKVSHKLYVDLFIKKLPINELSPLYQEKYSINKRHFNSIRFILEGKVSSILALNKNYILDTEEKIKELSKEIKYQQKEYNKYKTLPKLSLNKTQYEDKLKLCHKLEKNKQKLIKLNIKLNKLQKNKDNSNVQLCFGSKKLFKQQYEISKKNNLTKFKTHDEWYKEFDYQRNKELNFIGSKDETAGNTNCQITHITDNLFNLKININPKADKFIDKFINIKFRINQELNTLLNIVKNNQSHDKELWQPLMFKLIKQPDNGKHQGKYVIAISFNKYLSKKTYTSKNNGCIGVDINQDHLAVVNLDNKGNLLEINTFNYELNGTKYQNNNSISLAVKSLMELSVKLNKPVVIEQLDFQAKKKTLKAGVNKNRNKQLSSFAYSKVIELIKARAEDNYVEVREVNPAYTSIIGSIKYSVRSRISGHHGAAMCIGRKGIFNEYDENNKLSKEYKERKISKKNSQVKSLYLPVRKNIKAVEYWKELKKNMSKKKKEHEINCSDDTENKSTLLKTGKPNRLLRKIINANVLGSIHKVC